MNRFWNAAVGFKSHRGFWPIYTGFLIYALVAAYAGYSGIQWRLEVEQEQSAPPREFAETQSAWFRALRQVEEGAQVSSALARPMNLPVLAVRSPGVLAELSNRNEDLYPSVSVVDGFSNEMLLFRRYELDSPTSLQLGTLDLSFVVVVFLPLAVIFLGCDLLSADRETGRLKLAIASGFRSTILLWLRLLVATAPILLATYAVAVLTALLAAPLDLERVVSLLIWLGSAKCYWLFWVSLTAVIASFNRTSINAALTAVTAWVVLVVLMPGLLQTIGNAVYDSPSKVTLLSAARAAEAEALKSIERRVEAFMAGHTNEVALSDANVPDYYRNAYIGNQAVNQNIREQIEIVENAEANRTSLLQFLALASPVTQIQLAFEEIAQSGRARAKNYESQVREFLREYNETIGPATLAKARLTLAEAEAISEFRFRENDSLTSVWRGWMVLLLFATVLALIATRVATKIETRLN